MVWGQPSEKRDDEVQGHLGLEEDYKANAQHEGWGKKDEKPHHPAKPRGGKGQMRWYSRPNPMPTPTPRATWRRWRGVGKGNSRR